MPQRPTRVLVVTDHAEPSPALLAAVRARVAQGLSQFRILIPNPARAETDIFHPERHEKAEAAERVLHACLPALEEAAGGRVIGSVSIRNDPYDAVEEIRLNEPVDEFLVAIASHGLSRRLHHDLPHRLAHFGLPVTTIPASD